MKAMIRLSDWEVVDACLASSHETDVVELPVPLAWQKGPNRNTTLEDLGATSGSNGGTSFVLLVAMHRVLALTQH